MQQSLSLVARWRQVGYHLGPRREIHGMTMRVLMPSRDELATAVAKVSGALDLIALHDPRRYRRLRSDLRHIWVGATAARGEYDADLDMCVLQLAYVLSPETSAPRLALTIVHEATHARLNRVGIGYTEDIRARVERACVAAEIDFAARLPDGEALAEAARTRLAFDPAAFSDAAVQARREEALRAYGWGAKLGAGIMKLLVWADRRRTA